MPATEDLDAQHRAWLRAQLEHAADKVDGTLVGAPTFGWHDRSIGGLVTVAGKDRWLRLTSETSWWADGEFWIGNVQAQAIPNVPKPRLLARHEWSDGDRELYAELMTLAPSPAVTTDMVLRHMPDIDAGWWADLRRALHALAEHGTDRVCINGHDLRLRLLATFGIDVDPTKLDLTCAHGDLQWSNLTAPNLCLLDWEAWGTAPAGYDAAVLYCSSILRPEVAQEVHATFNDLLDTPTGRIAQLAAVTKFLRQVDQGDNLDVAAPLHAYARSVLDDLRR